VERAGLSSVRARGWGVPKESCRNLVADGIGPAGETVKKGGKLMSKLPSQRWFVVIFGLVALMGTGCNAVVSTVPVGNQPATLNPEEWEGIWYHPQGSTTIAVADPQHGILEVAFVGKDPNLGGRLTFKTLRVLVRTSDKWLFFNFRGENPVDPNYLWGRLQIDMEGRRILAWFPRADKFAQLVREGILPGKVDEKGNVTLSELREEHLRIITEEQKGVLFAWDSPLVLFKLSPLQ
jgi:hypothetical protein